MAATQTSGAVIVVRESNMYGLVSIIAMLSAATAALFIVVLLSCGMRKPVL